MSTPSQYCTLSPLFDLLGQKRIMHIIRIIETGTHRFNDIKASLGSVSSNILSQRLKDLETQGLIIKSVTTTPLTVSYHLSPKGEQIAQILHQLEQVSL